jgi:2-hydroxychromene-2-carboxylate isomerase
MAQPTLDFWLDYASTYSYIAAERIGALARDTGVAVRWRPFLLGPIFQAQGWHTSPFNIYPGKGRYMWRDMERICQALGLPLKRLEQFPQNSILAARVALVGFAEGWGEKFSRAVYRAEFGEARNIGETGVITNILDDLKRDAKDVIERALSADNKMRLRSETEEAQRLGIFGAPTFVTADGELFWGNDRLEAALAWARH